MPNWRIGLAVGAAALGGLAIASACQAADLNSSGAVLAHNCTVCHGVDGKGSLGIPKIRGLDRKDFAQSMRGFRSGAERQTIMGRLAKALNDQEIELLASYFSALP